MSKTAIVFFNLGGPDRLESVEPFLFNLFNDPAIIGAPSPIRWLIARLISKRRAPVAKEIYKKLGGKSPLVELTRLQANALENILNTNGSVEEYKAFIAMRYWHPMSLETAEAVRDYDPDNIVLLPLYPQYSMTTTGSSIAEWKRAAAIVGLSAPSTAVCCYPCNDGWVKAQASLTVEGLENDFDDKEPRILFSAHGLPKKIIEKGDPYQWQVEQTVEAVLQELRSMTSQAFSFSICYQSRVGPLEWIGPSTEDELQRAGNERTPVLVVPIAFVSEHSETLVELDVEYRELAEHWGVPSYHRIPAVGTNDHFIKGLADIVKTTAHNMDNANPVRCDNGSRICPRDRSQCPLTATLGLQ